MSNEESETMGSLLKQTLMTVDEVFVYKIPVLTSSGGHRADNWDLANPLATCGFQVERRNNDLYLIFTSEEHTKIFALAKYLHKNSIEPVTDSSRYFVTKLWSNDPKQNERSAYIGFGFRERDAALDLLQSLQGFQRSIQREQQAKAVIDKVTSNVAAVTLKSGEKMHISFGSKNKSTIVKEKRSPTASSKGKTTILLKKPPPAGTAETPPPVPTLSLPPKRDAAHITTPDTAATTIPAIPTPLSPPPTEQVGTKNEEADDDWGDFQGA